MTTPFDHTSLLFRVVFFGFARGTHHKLALDALLHLRGRHAERWRNVFLRYHEAYLEGSKAPDDTFKDFRNHVLHVSDNYWGGAVDAAKSWYYRTVDCLKRRDWEQAAYSAGVMSHYYTDPIMPLHTGQSQEETKVHRAMEWSVRHAYNELRELIPRRLGIPEVELPDSDDWIRDMVHAGAEAGHEHYDTCIHHFNLTAASREPASGLDRRLREVIGKLIAYAGVGFSRILERAVIESAASPPRINETLHGVLSTMKVPVYWVTRKLEDVRDRIMIEEMVAELEDTGEIEETLQEDDRIIRMMYEAEVLQGESIKSLPPRSESFAGRRRDNDEEEQDRDELEDTDNVVSFPSPRNESEDSDENRNSKRDYSNLTRDLDSKDEAETRSLRLTRSNHGSKEKRFYLHRDSEVVYAPSIGKKTAKRLAEIDVKTVDDLLNLKPKVAAEELNVRHIDPQTIRAWQVQAALVCRIPNLRGHDAQFLEAVGYSSPQMIAVADPDDLFEKVDEFVDTDEGERILRGGKRPNVDEIKEWIANATEARSLKAA